jgi:ATPase subunit of ABC transporter with duplicated ATPase domains
MSECFTILETGEFRSESKIGKTEWWAKDKSFSGGIQINHPEIILLDEPTNHLDLEGRNLLYDFIEKTSSTVVIVSHDRTLLNLVDTIFELSNQGISTYGGNYDFYAEQKEIENEALQNDIHSKERALKKARRRNAKHWNESKSLMQEEKETGKIGCGENYDEYAAE